MATTTPVLGLLKPVIGADDDLWGGFLNQNMDVLDAQVVTRGSGVAIVGTSPSSTVYEPLWWDSNSGQLFIQYDDGSSVQWVSANSIDASSLEGSFLPITGGTMQGPLNYTATGGTVSRSAQDRAAEVLYAEDYGVVPNATDNTAALQAFFAALQAFPNPVKGVLPSGWLYFTAPLTLSGKQWWTLVGSGIGATTFVYKGASTTVDLLKITNCFNFSLSGFAIDSNTVMTAGTALHLDGSGHAALTEIRMAGQSGATHIGPDSNMHYNLWNGFWFDKVDNVTLHNFEAAAQNDSMRVNGSVGAGYKAGLFLQFGKIMSSRVGLRVGGGFGGIYVDNTDIIGNWNNIVVDQSIAAEFNREVFIGIHVSSDSSGSVGTPTAPGPMNPGGGAIGDNVIINDPQGGFIFIKGWAVATYNGGHGIHVIAWSGVVRIDGCIVAYTNGDGIRIDTDVPSVIVTPGTNIHDVTGYGINKTTGARAVLGAPVFTVTHAGDLSPTTTLQLNAKTINAGSMYANGLLQAGVAAGGSQGTVAIVGSTTEQKQLAYYRGTGLAWVIGSGGPTDDLNFSRWDNSGVFQGNVLSLNRATGMLGPTAFGGGISFGGTAVAGVDLSKHIELYAGYAGFNVTSGQMNFILSAQTVMSCTAVASGIAMPLLRSSTSYANDAAAATGGVPVGQLYRNGSAVMVRVA